MKLPKKSLGQHWLKDEAFLSEIVKRAKINKTDTVLEIGPGPGSLTAQLVNRAEKVVAVELDSQLANELIWRVPAANLEVVNEDILRFNLTNLPSGYKVVANIPYYLTSNLLRTISESVNPPALMVLLVQKEVAKRICASQGQMSILSVSVQFYYEAAEGTVIPARYFSPPPKVDSQIVVLKRKKQPVLTDVDPNKFFQLVKAGFSSRRKKLRSSLSAGLRINKPAIDEILKKASINGDLRPQSLNLHDWGKIYRAIHRQ